MTECLAQFGVNFALLAAIFCNKLIAVKILQGYKRHWQQARVLGDGVSGTIRGDLCSFGGHFLQQSGLILRELTTSLFVMFC